MRYDGQSKGDPQLVAALSSHVQLIGHCPEVAIGMGVPRPAIQLLEQGGRLHAVGVADSDLDVTAALQQAAREFVHQHAGLCGYVFKSRSPSCGIGSTPVFQNNARLHEHGDGIFASSLQALVPQMPVADELQLQQPSQFQQFIHAAKTYFATLTS